MRHDDRDDERRRCEWAPEVRRRKPQLGTRELLGKMVNGPCAFLTKDQRRQVLSGDSASVDEVGNLLEHDFDQVVIALGVTIVSLDRRQAR